MNQFLVPGLWRTEERDSYTKLTLTDTQVDTMVVRARLAPAEASNSLIELDFLEADTDAYVPTSTDESSNYNAGAMEKLN